ncbi:MAG: pilus assembly protein [Pirellulales bacterium]|nr:pilus assembly protein [Pirellulales bacterium]
MKLPRIPIVCSHKAATVGRAHCEAASGDLAHCGPTSGIHLGYNLERSCRWCRINRQGAAAVEFALVAPLFFLMVFGMIEFGRMIMVQQVITNATREGARIAVLDSQTATASLVASTVSDYLQNAGISGETVTIDPAEPTSAAYGEPVTVTVQVPFSSVSWLPAPMFISANTNLTASAVMRRETAQ